MYSKLDLIDWGDAEASWALASLPKLPHGRIGSLYMPPKPIRVKERTSHPVLPKLDLNARERCAVTRELQRQGFIFRKIVRD